MSFSPSLLSFLLWLRECADVDLIKTTTFNLLPWCWGEVSPVSQSQVLYKQSKHIAYRLYFRRKIRWFGRRRRSAVKKCVVKVLLNFAILGSDIFLNKRRESTSAPWQPEANRTGRGILSAKLTFPNHSMENQDLQSLFMTTNQTASLQMLWINARIYCGSFTEVILSNWVKFHF